MSNISTCIWNVAVGDQYIHCLKTNISTYNMKHKPTSNFKYFTLAFTMRSKY